jgi:PAS domain S-box-containing protein
LLTPNRDVANNDLLFNQIAQAAAIACNAQMGLISFIQQDQQHRFKSTYGFRPEDLSLEFILHLNLKAGEVFVGGAQLEEQFVKSPVFKEYGSKIVALVPFSRPDSQLAGYLGILDGESKPLSAAQIDLLKTLADSALGLFELRRKEADLAKLKAQYLEIQTLVKVGAWELDVVSGNTLWSDQIYDIYGIPHGTPTNKVDGLAHYAPLDQVKLADLISKCIQEKESFNDVFEFYDTQSRRKWVRSIGRPVIDGNDKVSKVIGTIQDVTAEEQKELELNLVLENISEGYFDWHIKNEFEYMSAKFWDMLGYNSSTKQHHPSEWQKLLHPQDVERARMSFNLHIDSTGVTPYAVDLRFRHAKGHYLWLKREGKVIEWSQEGEPLRMVGSLRNIHHDKINTLEAFTLKQGVDAHAIVARTDERGVIIFANELFCKISKYQREELIGRDHRIVNSGHHPKSFFANMWETIKAKQIWRGEIKNRAKDGSYYWVDTTIVPQLDLNGEIQGYISFRYDITQRKNAEALLLASENKHKQLFMQSKDALLTLEAPGWKFTSCNSMAIKLFEVVDEADLLQLGLLDISPDFQANGRDSASLAHEVIQIALDQGSHFFEWIHRTISGREIPCTVLFSRIKDQDRVYLHATIRDVTKEKELHQGLVEANEYLDLAVEGANLGIWDWDLRDNSVRYSERWANLRGLSIGDLKNDLSDWESRVHPNDLPLAYEVINSYLTGKIPYFEHVHRIKHQNGNWIHVLGRGRFSAWDETGKPIRFTGTDYDVTELVSSKAKLDLFFEKAPYGFVFSDLNGNFIDTNRELERITGYGREELVGMTFKNFDRGPKQEKDASGPFRTTWMRKDGSQLPLQINGFVVEDYAGQAGIWSIVEDISAKVKLENEKNDLLTSYQKLNEKLEAIFKFSPVVVFECHIGASWTISFVNAQIEELTGYSAQEILDNPDLGFMHLTHPEDVPMAEGNTLRAIAESKAYSIEYRLLHKDGSIRWVLERGAQAPGSDRLIGVMLDITERRNAQDELNKVSSELNKFFDLALSYLCIVDTDGHFKKINSSWLQLGYSQQELLSQPFQSLIHPDDILPSKGEFEKLSRGQSVIGYENRYRKKDGRYMTLQWSSSADPETGNIYGTAIDVTERKRREEIILLISHVRSKFIELSSDKKAFFSYLLKKIIQITESQYGFIGEICEDSTGKYLKTLDLTDISWDEITSKFYQDNAPQGLEFRNLDTIFGHVIKSGQLLITNDAKRHPKAAGVPSGHPPLDSFMGVPIFYNNSMFAMVGLANKKNGFTFDDYHYLKPFFELCGEMLHTIKLSEELENQKRIAVHQSKLASIGQLAAGVGHEINNPLAIIEGHLMVLNDHIRDKYAEDSLVEAKFQKIFKATTRIANIVKGLRTFARSDDVDFVRFNFSELLLETIETLREFFEREKITFHVDVQDGLWVNGNRGRIQQVFVNIITNARDAIASADKKFISVSSVLSGRSIVTTIADSGPGVPKNLQERIFDPFFTTKDVNKGTGIGLALANSIVKEHSGSLTLDADFTTGAAFVISLPAAERSRNIPLSPPRVQEGQGEVTFTGEVLIVEDEDELRDILHKILEKFGLKVHTATNGIEALQILRAHPGQISLIFSDLKMPEMNGYELVRTVRTNQGYQGGFIFVTGGVDVSLEDCQDLIDGILQKPYSKAQIQRYLEKWFTPRDENIA